MGCAATLGTAIIFCSPNQPHAQRLAKEQDVNITGVASRTSDKESVVSITGDGNLTRAQTWQDKDGYFHIVLPKGQTALRNSGAARGVKMQRVGNSLEIIVQSKPGASVTVQPRFNRLDLIVNGGLQEVSDEKQEHAGKASNEPWSQDSASKGAVRGSEDEASPRQNVKRRLGSALASAPQNFLAPREAQASGTPLIASALSTHNNQSQTTTQPNALLQGAGATPQQWNAPAAATGTEATSTAAVSATPENAQSAPPVEPTTVAEDATQESSFIFSSTGLLGLLGTIGLGSLVFLHRRRNAGWEDEETEETTLTAKKETKTKAKAKDGKKNTVEAEDEQPFEHPKGDRRKGNDRRELARGFGDRRKSGQGAEASATLQAHFNAKDLETGHGAKQERKTEGRLSFGSAMPAVLFGAYRIDQEVGKLVAGDAHSIEVLASRATDDRRAVETSLIKALQSPEADEDVQRRARTSLEEYGFVARLSAALLMAQEAYERASAARVLGEIKSSSSLPFLLEALYDPETVVRTEVIASLGSLGLPRAIGPMLDVARRYPEMPTSVLAPALSACSVETIETTLSDASESRAFALRLAGQQSFTGEITGLEAVGKVEELPEWLEDETLADALDRLGSVDVEARAAAAQSLAQYQVQRSVEALSAMAARDPEPNVRATAVTSLGTIDHESVFAPVLMAMADEAREVRAAAARSLSRLSFDRADAYVRVIETANAATVCGVARACIKAGLAAQAIDRLTSEDRRQAYEAFSLLSLVIKAGETAPVLDAIEHHGNLNVRLAAIKLLGMMGHSAEFVETLRQLSQRGGLPEMVRGAIMEALNNVPQTNMQAV
ncbi:MAG TPA: HEAT repeat domain-containing protein [Pyrinomonadaceae bacterium]|jgi:HEAT repeat protein